MKRIILTAFALMTVVTNFAWAAADSTDTKVPAKKGSGLFEDILSLPADTAGSIFSLGEIRVGGGRVPSELSDDKLMDAPYNVSVLERGAIEESGAAYLPNVLARQEGINLADDMGQGRNARLDLRGFGGEGKNALVVFDGLRAVEPFDNSVTWHLYPSDYIERVEVLRGSGSTIYGEGAFSGVVRLETKKPTKDLHVATEHTWGDYLTEKHFAEASGTSNGVGLYIGARYEDTEGYRQNNSHEAVSSLLKVNGDVTDRIRIENAFYFADDTTGIPGPLLPAEAEVDRRQKDPDGQFGDAFEDRLVQDSVTATLAMDELGLELSNQTGYRLRDQNSLQSFGGSFPGISSNEIGTETFSNVLQGAWKWERGVARNDVIAGVEWSIDDIHNPFTFQDLTFGPFSSERSIDRRMLGFFVQEKLRFWERLTLEGSARYDRIHWDIYDLLSPPLEKQKQTDHLSPKISAEFAVRPDLAVYGGFAEAFKAPDSNTLIFETPNLFTPNPSIDPQVARHYEIGVRAGDSKRLSARADGFYIETKKEILFNDVTNLNENFDTKRSGFEVFGDWRPADFLSLFAGYTFTRAEFDNGAFDGEHIPLTPEHKWSAGATLTPLPGLSASAQAVGVSDQFALNDFNNIFPAENYVTVDARVAYKKDGWQVFLRAENLLGEEYSSFVTSNAVDTVNLNPAPGRYFEAGFRLET